MERGEQGISRTSLNFQSTLNNSSEQDWEVIHNNYEEPEVVNIESPNALEYTSLNKQAPSSSNILNARNGTPEIQVTEPDIIDTHIGALSIDELMPKDDNGISR